MTMTSNGNCCVLLLLYSLVEMLVVMELPTSYLELLPEKKTRLTFTLIDYGLRLMRVSHLGLMAYFLFKLCI